MNETLNILEAFKQRTQEEVQQLEYMRKIAPETRQLIFGTLLSDNEIETQIQEKNNQINEANQLLCIKDCLDILSDESCDQVRERTTALLKGEKHSLRLDK